MVKNYQNAYWGKELYGKSKEPLLVVDRRKTVEQKADFRKRYSFINWRRARTAFNGFDGEVVERL
jgi:hypothetical protein